MKGGQPISIDDLMRWKNKENFSVEQVFEMVSQLFDPPLPRYKFADLSNNFYWVNQTLDVCETCYLQFTNSKLEDLHFAPESLQTEKYPMRKKSQSTKINIGNNHEPKEKKVKEITKVSSPKPNKGFVLKTEPYEFSTPRVKTAYSVGGGLRNLGSLGMNSDRPFSKMSHTTLMQPTAVLMNHKIDRITSSSRRRL